MFRFALARILENHHIINRIIERYFAHDNKHLDDEKRQEFSTQNNFMNNLKYLNFFLFIPNFNYAKYIKTIINFSKIFIFFILKIIMMTIKLLGKLLGQTSLVFKLIYSFYSVKQLITVIISRYCNIKKEISLAVIFIISFFNKKAKKCSVSTQQNKKVLEEWFELNKKNPYATKKQRIELANKSNISYEKVTKFLQNARLRYNQKQLTVLN